MRNLTQLCRFTSLAAAILATSLLVNVPVTQASAEETSFAGARYESGCVGVCTPSGHLDLNGQSNVVIENLHISNPNGRCLSLDNASNITIKNSRIGPCATANGINDGYETGVITIRNSDNITLEGNLIEDIASESTVSLRNNAIWVTNSPNVTIQDNTIRDVHSDIAQKNNNYGNRAIGVNGGSPNFVATHNTFQNAGRNALQFQRNYNVAGVEFSHNVIEGTAHWGSDYEDMINFYGSTGTPSSPITVQGNYLRFGGPSSTGTGLIVGDGNSSIGTNAHVVVADNVIVNPGHVGIGVAGGSSIIVRDNIIYSEHHNSTLQTAVGMYVAQLGYGPACDNILVERNRIFFVNQHLGSGTNHLWNPGTCHGATLRDNVIGDASLSMSVWNPGEPEPNEAASPPSPTTTAPPAVSTTAAPPTTAVRPDSPDTSTELPDTESTVDAASAPTAAPPLEQVLPGTQGEPPQLDDDLTSTTTSSSIPALPADASESADRSPRSGPVEADDEAPVDAEADAGTDTDTDTEPPEQLALHTSESNQASGTSPWIPLSLAAAGGTAVAVAVRSRMFGSVVSR